MSGGLSTFQVGEKVGFLYESGGGTVRKIDSLGIFHVEDETGFERPFRQNELVKIYGSDYHLPDNVDLQRNDDDSLTRTNYTSHKETKTGSRKPIDIWDIIATIMTGFISHLIYNTIFKSSQLNEKITNREHRIGNSGA